MGYALIWIESLATALLFVALFTALSGRLKKRLWQIIWPIIAALLPFFIFISATVLGYILHNNHMEPSWLFGYTLSLTVPCLFGIILLIYYGLRRSRNVPLSQNWPRGRIAITFSLVLILSLCTLYFLDLSMRIRLATVQAEARTLTLSLLPARVPDHRNAAIMYDKAFEAFGKNIPNWFNQSGNPDFDTTKENVDKFLKDKKDVMTLLHQAATMPDHYVEIDLSNLLMLTTLDFIDRRNAARLLALDARSKAARGEIKDAMESINDIRSLATHTLQIPYLINVMIAATIDNIGSRTLENILTSIQTLPQDIVNWPVKTTDHYHNVFKHAFIMEEAHMLYILSRMEDELKHDISSYLLSQDTIPMQKKTTEQIKSWIPSQHNCGVYFFCLQTSPQVGKECVNYKRLLQDLTTRFVRN